MRSVSVLGSTGSVGTSTLGVVRKNRSSFCVHALTAHKNVTALASQAKEFNAKLAVIADETLYDVLKELLSGSGIECAAGHDAVTDAASITVDVTMAAIVGMAGLKPLLASIENGRHVAIANKEPLVAAGFLVTQAAQKSGAVLLPVDSEHNAIFQVLETKNKNAIHRIILTASGGPFRTWDLQKMETATRAEALAHPNWVMGQKISIDSATMMNKALEVVEAHHLFDMPSDKIDVLVHPQSVIHSMLEYADGSVLSQMGASDMTVPITHALGWPSRIDGGAKRLDFLTLPPLTFEKVDDRRFPAINLAYASLQSGSAACIALNAANEVAVDAFLKDKIGFMDICAIVRDVLDGVNETVSNNIDAVLAFDSKMRNATQSRITTKQNHNRKVS